MIRWAEKFNKNIPLESWEYLREKTLKMSACTRLKENALKIIYRWYMTPEKIALI